LKEELRNYISEMIGSMAKPDDMIFLTELPKLEGGKIDRGVLREKAKEGLKELTGEEAEHQIILEKLRAEYQSSKGEYFG
jgi:acetyl-CoA synthetase